MVWISGWRAYARLAALSLSGGMLLAFPGCGSHWYDYVLNFEAGVVVTQVASQLGGGLPF